MVGRVGEMGGSSAGVDRSLATTAAPGPPGRRRWRWTAALPTAAMVTLAIVYVGTLSDWDEFTDTIAAVSGSGLALVIAIAAVNVVTYWLVLSAALPGLRPDRAGLVQLPATALSNLVPGGGALGTGFTFVALRRWGFRSEEVAAAALITGVAGTVAKLAAPLAVLVVVVPSGGDAGVFATAGLAALALALMVGGLIALLGSDRAMARGARVTARLAVLSPRLPAADHWEDAAIRFHARLRALLARRGRAIAGTTIFSHVALFVLFLASVRVTGLQHDGVGFVEAFTVFAVARAVALVPLTPGGIGLIELSLTATLTAAGGEGDRVVAAVVLYRSATYLLPTVLGAVLLVGWTLVRHRAAPSMPAAGSTDVPLVVDLDGTLLPVTTRVLMLARLCRQGPRAVRQYRRRVLADPLGSKWFLWERAGLDLDAVPIRAQLLRWLDAERARGRELYVASGAPDPLVRSFVAAHPLFTDGWGSDERIRLVGTAKAELLSERFAATGFDYVGDAVEDLAVWNVARTAVVCNAPRRLERTARATLPSVEVVPRSRLASVALVGHAVAALVGQWRTPGTAVAYDGARRPAALTGTRRRVPPS